MGTRSGYKMVDEDDPQWKRFWNAYPLRTAKKEARKAWAQLNPSPEDVNEMLVTLVWQSALWATQGYGVPYPASWLRGERWKDEPVPKPNLRRTEVGWAKVDDSQYRDQLAAYLKRKGMA